VGLRNYKDKLFKGIFNNKEQALLLFNALVENEEDKCFDTRELKVVTLSDSSVFIEKVSFRNDLAIIVQNDLWLFEHQSTWNPNMPLRGLIYYALEMIDLTEKEKEESEKGNPLFWNERYKIPAPKYYVLYNGKDKKTIPDVLKLSDSFMSKSEGYEWTAYVKDIRSASGKELLENCAPLRDYTYTVEKAEYYVSNGYREEEAIQMAINELDKLSWVRKNIRELSAVLFDDGSAEMELRREREKRFEIACELIHERGFSEDEAFGIARITDEEIFAYTSWFLKRK